MKKIILFLSAIALFVACDKDENSQSAPTNDLYVNGSLITNESSLTYYKGDNTLVVEGFAYTANLTGTTLPIIGVTEVDDNTLTGDNITADYIFMTMPASNAVSGLTASFNGNDAELEFTISAAMYNNNTASDYLCKYSGEVTIVDDSYEGFYITISTGSTSLVSGVSITYYEGDDTLVIDGFKFNTAMPSGSILAIDGVTESVNNYGLTTITGNDISIDYTIMYQPYSGTISDLNCEIFNTKTQLKFWILHDGFNYPCTYNGDITISNGSYGLN